MVGRARAEEMDRLSKDIRSRVMGSVGRENTRAERVVRSMLHRKGFRFRLHQKDLPGSPDIVLPRYDLAIFVHGCFWHSHSCPRGERPRSNVSFWNAKLDANVRRDARNVKALRRHGWSVLIVWECETATPEKLEQKLLTRLRRASALKPVDSRKL
jgi:DNA mismatch endonuclease (patch repair protein)